MSNTSESLHAITGEQTASPAYMDGKKAAMALMHQIAAEHGEVPRAVQGTMPIDFAPDSADDPGSPSAAEPASPAVEAPQSNATAVGWEPIKGDPQAASGDAGGGPDGSAGTGDETIVDGLPGIVSETATVPEPDDQGSVAASASGPPMGMIVAAIVAKLAP